MKLSDIKSLEPTPEVVAERLGDTFVLVHSETNKIFELSVTASMCWELISSGCSVSTLRDRMLEEFEVDSNQLDIELIATLENLLEEKLVRSRV